MEAASRKSRIAAYKERKIAAGIFAIRCGTTGECWIGCAPDLDTIWRRLSFELAQGSRRCASLQAAWHCHGAADFAFEVLETIEEEIESVRDKRLKARLAALREKLGAELA